MHRHSQQMALIFSIMPDTGAMSHVVLELLYVYKCHLIFVFNGGIKQRHILNLNNFNRHLNASFFIDLRVVWFGLIGSITSHSTIFQLHL